MAGRAEVSGMAYKEFSPEERIAIVESYLITCHRRGAVKELCEKHGLSRGRIANWLKDVRRRADIIFADDATLLQRKDLAREVSRLLLQNRNLWQRIRELNPDEPLGNE
jgi:transposase-like protein